MQAHCRGSSHIAVKWFLLPGSMLDKDTFMELLANILSLEAQKQISECEKQLVATGFQYQIFEWEKQ
eukprot:3189133-Amphidinium_carterae.1